MQLSEAKTELVEIKGRIFQRPYGLLKVVWVGLVFLPPLIMFLIIQDLVVNVPFVDGWEIAPMLTKIRSGNGLTFNDLWSVHVDHRIPVQRLIHLGLILITGSWSNLTEVYAQLGLQLLGLFILWRLLKASLPAWVVPPLLIAYSWLLFSPAQYENWLNGFHIAWFQLTTPMLALIWLINRWSGRWWSLGLAMLAALTASFALVSGLILWVLGLGGLIVARYTLKPRWSWRAIAVWGGTAIILILVYFYDYKSGTGQQSLEYLTKHLIEWPYYIVAYLGSALAALWGDMAAAFWYGLGGLLIAGIAVGYLWRRNIKPWHPRLLPWIEIVIFVGISGAITGVGRISLLGQSLIASRYLTATNFFWVGFSAIVTLAGVELWREWREQESRPRLIWLLGGATGLIIPLVLGYILSYNQGYQNMKALSSDREADRYFLYDYGAVLPEMIVDLYPEVGALQQWAYGLEKFKDGPFRLPAAEYRQQLADKWNKRLSATNYQRYSMPGENLKPVEDKGISTFSGYKANQVEFINEGRKGTFYKTRLPRGDESRLGWWGGPETRILDIQLKEAIYVTLTWNNGQKAILYGLEGSDGWKHFRANVPSGITELEINLHYRVSRPQSDIMQLDLYQA